MGESIGQMSRPPALSATVQSRPEEVFVARRPSDEVQLAEIARKHTWARTWRIFIGAVGLALVILATWPTAHVLSGRETVLNIQVALGLTASVTLAGVGTATWGNSQRRRANRLNGRNEQLSRDVKELQRRLEVAHLDSSVSR
jgi:type VI protein secretion system component VasK